LFSGSVLEWGDAAGGGEPKGAGVHADEWGGPIGGGAGAAAEDAGLERYYENRSIVPLHKRDGGVDLITIPRDFASLCSTHMYDDGDRGGDA